MHKVNGKSLIFTDIHFGLKQNSISRLNICIKVIKQILDTVKNDDIKNVFFAGDLFHERVSVNVNTLNVALKCINTLAKYCKVFLIVGNHDIHYKNITEVNSLNMFKQNSNIVVVDSATQVELNGDKVLLCPWLTKFDGQQKCSYDFMIGHFDINEKYWMKSYLSNNANQLNANYSSQRKIDYDSLLSKHAETAQNDTAEEFIQLVKETGTVFSGHIHLHKVTSISQRKFIFVGSPYEQTRGEIGNECGYYVLDEDNKYHFVKTVGTPKHIDLRMSDIVSVGVDNYDFNIVHENIIHKIYDIDIDRVLDSKIDQKILDFSPYDELIPDYEVEIGADNQISGSNITLDIIKKSKLDYIKNYIDNIDKDALTEQDIDPKKLYELLSEYYLQIAVE